MKNNVVRKIILEDGTQYIGTGFGSLEDKKLELVFNTSMVGYQEIISDPSYTDQAVVMTYPLIGNYGINDDDFETKNPSIGALIVREYTEIPSNFRCSISLGDYMKKTGIAGIEGVDTREITRKIRNYGSCKVLLTGESTTLEEGVEILKKWDFAHDQVSRVTSREIWVSEPNGTTPDEGKASCHVVAIDCGMKLNIVRSLNKLGCKVTVVPFNTDAGVIENMKPDGIFLSNGPGDPTDVVETIETIKKLKGKYPIFGICLGHQMLSLAYGAKTYKLKFGHRGGNHPVKNLLTDKIEITSQNHSFAVDDESLKNTKLIKTHINMLDNTIEGVCCPEDKAFSIQYHPESAPGPQDSEYLFHEFVNLMKGGSINA
ncbi:MAG: glutamine-hydrolyzing carbamoyl-phosphate synthase small subunit [Lachnospiraceae bacterium]|nr:glutamine-hydrolyzing carbamoyl-phosphate synthase small subunit [Lachnospiraceae bacterium]